MSRVKGSPFHQKHTVVLECDHPVTYPGMPPKLNALVWCVRCDTGRVVKRYVPVS